MPGIRVEFIVTGGETFKQCSICEEYLELMEFRRIVRGNASGYRSECKKCTKDYKSIYRLSNPERAKKLANNSRLKSRYGITWDSYVTKLEEQGGICSICKLPPSGKRRIAVDHCHKTGKIRELLCTRCNASLGLMRENVEALTNMIKYIKRYEV